MTSELIAIKEEMIKAALRAYQIGLQTGNGGNLSCRVPGTDTVIIKGSGLSFGECRPDNFVMVTMEGKVIDETGKPSRELLTHLCIYRLRPDVHGIFHTHSPWSIACANDSHEIPLITGHAKAKLGPIPVIRDEDHATRDFVAAVKNLLIEQPQLGAFVQSGHGIFGLGKDISHAEHNAELVEETAQIALLVSLRKSHF
ncbi:MAG: class II aldolase/adducin family protein [Desulfobacterales bacterium]|nr:class II aldolase/adducin family protein [Desulfobacterales bacterium]